MSDKVSLNIKISLFIIVPIIIIIVIFGIINTIYIYNMTKTDIFIWNISNV